MPAFNYSAVDSQGKEKKGRIEADSENDANSKLKEQGLFPTSVSPAKGGGGGKKGGQKKGGGKGGGGGFNLVIGARKIKAKNLPVFTRQLATLLDAGLPLVRALRTLERQNKDPLEQQTINAIAESVEGGQTFSEALAQQRKSFDRLYVNMIKAGEASGALEEVLSKLATYMEKAAKLKAKVKSALIYPAVVLFIAGTITTGLMIFIVPKFAKMFDEMLGGEPLPGLTQFVIMISDIMVNRAWIAVIFVVLLVIAFKIIKSTKTGSYMIDLILYKLPPFSALVVKSQSARFCSTLGTLLQSGVSVLNALQIVRDTSGNAVVSTAVQTVHDAVKEGEGMAKPMESTKAFPLMVVSMVEVGEETGALPEMLVRIAGIYEEEVDMAVDGLTSLIEPLMIVVMGVLIGGIVLAMFMPLIKLIENLGG